jgi:hypothetical protein
VSLFDKKEEEKKKKKTHFSMPRPPGVIRWLGSIRAASRPFFGKKRITRGKRSRR